MHQPPFLKNNDRVAIVATAKNFEQQDLRIGIDMLKSWGLEVVLGKNIYNKFHQFAGTDGERLADLQAALDDPSIKAIFCARGGYGTARIIDEVNFANFLMYPKWVIGFSDITVLHCHLNNLGFQTIHSTMPSLFGRPGYEKSVEELHTLLFGSVPEIEIPISALQKNGYAEGNLVGGNLTILHTIIGTNSEISFDNKILFIEDISENLYHHDRMLVHFKRLGKLKNLAGLLVGHFTDMKDNDVAFGKDAYEIIAETVSDYNYPVAYNFPVGHEAINLPVICGKMAKLNVSETSVILDYQNHIA